MKKKILLAFMLFVVGCLSFITSSTIVTGCAGKLPTVATFVYTSTITKTPTITPTPTP